MENLGKDFEKFTKKARWKKWLKIILTSLISAVVAVFALGAGLNWYSDHLSLSYQNSTNAAAQYAWSQNENVSTTSPIQEPYGALDKEAVIATYKNIDGYHVPWQTQNWVNGQLINKYGALTFSGNNAFLDSTQQKVALFYTTDEKILQSKNYVWGQPTHIADTISTLKNQVAEVAVTFDKPYTYAEIQQMIPSNLLINWYWAGGLAENINPNALGIPSPFGIPSDVDNEGNPTGKLTNADYANAVGGMNSKNLVELMVNGASYLYKDTNDNFAKAAAHVKYSEELKLADAKFSGVILTGRTQNFAHLDKKSWVFATNTGVTTEIRPDIAPIK